MRLLYGVGLDAQHIATEVIVALLAQLSEETVALAHQAGIAKLSTLMHQASVRGGGNDAVDARRHGQILDIAIAPRLAQMHGVAEPRLQPIGKGVGVVGNTTIKVAKVAQGVLCYPRAQLGVDRRDEDGLRGKGAEEPVA